ncbi:MAG: hypothetical protein IKI76_01790 [Selenomonadaceae bacterium]|nr:hypothetical protein [Selenomonadaceae bacterium]
MVLLMLGYFVMGLIFLILRFFYHILPKKGSRNNLVRSVRDDFVILYAYVKQIVVSNPKKIEFIVMIMVCLIILPLTPLQLEIEFVAEDFLSLIMFFVLVVIFAPKEDPTEKGFPVEIFGFIYSIIFMYYSAGVLVFDVFYAIDSLREDRWIYGYSITVISYVLCIATLSRFMERELSKQEIILLGMIMLTTLEFITYYGIGFFGGMKWYDYDPLAYEFNILNIFGDITTIINQGIFIASQSQILERTPSEIWGYIILNGTDVLTITVVLGYLVQKFMEM